MKISAVTINNSVGTSANNNKVNKTPVNNVQYCTSLKVQQNTPSFGKFILDDMFNWGKKQLNKQRELIRKEQIQSVRQHVIDDINILTARENISYREATAIYQGDLEIGGIKPKGDGHERGLNRVVGYSLEKLELLKRVVVPTVRKSKNEIVKNVPHGVVIFGPPGTGKSHMAESLLDHINVKNPEKLKAITLNGDWIKGDTKENIGLIRTAFEKAKIEGQDDTKHTFILINRMDDIFAADNELQAEFKKHTKKSAENGVTWVGTTNSPLNLPKWMFEKDRTSVAIPLDRMKSDAEISATFSHFIAEKDRKDNTKHDVILDYAKEQRLICYPPVIREIINNVDTQLRSKDRYSPKSGTYKAPVRNSDIRNAIDEYKSSIKK